MFVEHEVFIGLRDVALDHKVTNTALLSYLEDAGGVHSNLAGYGLKDIPKVKRSWVLLNWQIEIFQRPTYGEKIMIKTWSRGIERLYAYRDFEILNEAKEKIGIATSKWVLLDTENLKITKPGKEVENAYTVENKSVFEKPDLGKMAEPESYDGSTNFYVNRSLIDVNNHLHNIYFMDIANEVLPMDIYKNAQFDNICMMCKKEIKLGDTVKVFYSKVENGYTIVIKSEDEQILHGIIALQ